MVPIKRTVFLRYEKYGAFNRNTRVVGTLPNRRPRTDKFTTWTVLNFGAL